MKNSGLMMIMPIDYEDLILEAQEREEHPELGEPLWGREPENLTKDCPTCGEDNGSSGGLGNTNHYNCRSCGTWYD